MDPSPFFVAAGPLGFLGLGLITASWANRNPAMMGRLALIWGFVVLGLALFCPILMAFQGPLRWSVPLFGPENPIRLGILFDPLSAIMFALISFIGLVILRYSMTYLDGEPTQGRFMKWIAFTLGSVMFLVVSGNLIQFTAAWIMTSFGLHHLLTHYPDRPSAMIAAHKKFLISRLGDLMLLGALVLTYLMVGSFEYSEIFAAAQKVSIPDESNLAGTGQERSAWFLPWIGFLYVLGAMTKSAQFPLHTWLPDTMETPTPVSALMHAGIINAGGFLILRLSPLVIQSHMAMDLLALVGGITALYGALVLPTQTSVKRALAYSTIAQMGFMMLQCGLGVFSGALLHIVAHSLYKAHAFLSSGSVLDRAAAMRPCRIEKPTQNQSSILLGFAMFLSALLTLGFDVMVHPAPFEKPGGVLLNLILFLAIGQLLWMAFQTRNLRLVGIGILSAVIMIVFYQTAYGAIESLLVDSVAHQTEPLSVFDSVIIVLVGVGFIGIFSLQALLPFVGKGSFFQAFYCHAVNGFYLDISATRLALRIWPQKPLITR